MIPNKIWQTYECEYKDLPKTILSYTETWKKLNPNYEYIYHSAEDRNQFVFKEYGKEWFDIFTSMPYNVMRADLWRYMIINKYGGVYTDIDSICKKPIDFWKKDEYDMILISSSPKDKTFVQYLFASISNNIILDNVLQKCKDRLININHYKNNLVEETTGYKVWNDGIGKKLYSSKNIKYKAKDINIYAYTGVDSNTINVDSIDHKAGSINLIDGYPTWREEIL